MFEQYLSVKREYPDALLFYRMGDFYEMFYEDAETAARELSITLTCRNPNAEFRVPMCGVPHHSAEGYIKKLLERGYKVAVCDQIEDPRQAKGLVKRAVTRVRTPGTEVEDDTLAAKRNNFLAALFWDADRSAGGLGWVDVSTGEWSGLQSTRDADLLQWTLKMAPSELLLAEGAELPHALDHALPASLRQVLADVGVRLTRVPARAYFDRAGAEKKILAAQDVADMAVLDLGDKPELVRCLGALLSYLTQTQKRENIRLWQFRPLDLSRHLLLDEVTERNLEIFRRLDGRRGPGTLWHVLDRTLTPMGGRLLAERLRHPWREVRPVLACQEAVAWFFGSDGLRERVREALGTVYDLERLSTRICLNRSAPRDFVSLRASLAALPQLRGILEEALGASEDGSEGAGPATVPASLSGLLAAWDDLDDFADLLGRALVDSPPPVITEGGLFRAGYSAELDELLDLSEHGEAKLQELLESERAAHDLPKLKLGFNRVFGYFFELPKGQVALAPDHFIRRQTLAAGERYTTEALKALEEKFVSAEDRRKSLEYNLFQELRSTVAGARDRFAHMSGVLAGLDYWQCLADAARRWNWTRPEVHEGIEIEVRAGRHPVVEAVQGAEFIPNDLRMDAQRRILLITGPNMAGKSTVLRQAALLCILAQIGSFVPAAEARIGLADRIFSRVGASDNLAQGQSTFMVEMTETARILRQATRRSLVILDEIGRGTSTFDGLALAWSVVEELSRRARGEIRTLFATHYHELTALEGKVDGVRNMNIAIKEYGGDIVFLRRLVPGPSDRSYGIEVARLAGVPRPVVARAREILGELEKKAREAEEIVAEVKAAQGLLPGFEPAGPTGDRAGEVREHPVVEELRRLEPDNLTPMEALALLARFKREVGE
ncbi:MAG: DNA mismatch repair protein MutS [Desulfovibrionaceae bacterium]|nr:DNA mismatch repair protein MutS [Desulfovibrionaceae bacterium]